MKDEHKTKVIFRKEENGDILAVFPALAGNSNPYGMCLCYAHVGQHCAMEIAYMQKTTPARTLDYCDLIKELESLGYNLHISKRFSAKDLQARIEQTKR